MFRLVLLRFSFLVVVGVVAVVPDAAADATVVMDTSTRLDRTKDAVLETDGKNIYRMTLFFYKRGEVFGVR